MNEAKANIESCRQRVYLLRRGPGSAEILTESKNVGHW